MEVFGYHISEQWLILITGMFGVLLLIGTFNFIAMVKREKAFKARQLVAQQAAADHASRLITQKTGFIGPKRTVAVDARREVA